MSVLLEMAIFPTDKGESKSEYVTRVVEMIKESGHSYQFTPMATIIETDTMREALDLVEKAYKVLDDCNRVYSVLKFDVRKNRKNALEEKVKSVESKLNK